MSSEDPAFQRELLVRAFMKCPAFDPNETPSIGDIRRREDGMRILWLGHEWEEMGNPFPPDRAVKGNSDRSS